MPLLILVKAFFLGVCMNYIRVGLLLVFVSSLMFGYHYKSKYDDLMVELKEKELQAVIAKEQRNNEYNQTTITFNEKLHADIDNVVKNFNAIVILECEKPICVEIYNNIKQLGRIALRSEGETIAIGFVQEFI